MNITPEEFFNTILEFLPSVVSAYNQSIEHYNQKLETVLIEDIIMPEIINLLCKETDIKLIKGIFDYFEEVSNFGDNHLLNIFSITALEIFGNDKEILKLAQKYMGPKTMKLQIEADRELGRL